MGALVDLIPAKGRKIIYAILSAGLALYGIWQATEGNWVDFVVAINTSAVGLLATANTDVQVESE